MVWQLWIKTYFNRFGPLCLSRSVVIQQHTRAALSLIMFTVHRTVIENTHWLRHCNYPHSAHTEMLSCMLSSILKEEITRCDEMMSSAGVQRCLHSVFCSTVCGRNQHWCDDCDGGEEDNNINYLVPFLSLLRHVCAFFSSFLSSPNCLPASQSAKLHCVWLCSPVGASWVLVSETCMHCLKPLSHANNCVPDWCPMHFSYGSLAVWATSKKFLPSHRLPPPHLAVLYRSLPYTLYFHLILIPPHAHFQPLSLKSMELILLGLMDFAAKVRRMHFNHGRS